MALSWPNTYLESLTDEHRRWLGAFDAQYLRNWQKLLNADDEAAMAEARVRQVLEQWGVKVEPNEDLGGGTQRPDFRCLKGEAVFYMEVTCISKETATAKTGIPDESHGMTACRPLNDAIFSECKGKASQCGNVDGPCLLAVGTWHTFAAMFSFKRPVVDWLLTGEAKLAWNIDMQTGQQVGDDYQVTELYSAAFLRPDLNEEVGFARSSISGLVLCSYGSERACRIGVLHPNPARPFDSSLLPDMKVGSVCIDRQSPQMHVSWPEGNDD